MPRRNGSRAAIIENALVTLAGKNPPKATKVLTDATHAANGYVDESKLFAVELPKIDGVKAQYVAPQIDAKGKPTVEGATLGAKTWRSAWFSLTVNAYRRDNDGPADAMALANAIVGEPFVTYKGKTYLVVSQGVRDDARKS